jgi:hypothetical protein
MARASNSVEGRLFSPVQRSPGTFQPTMQWVPGLFPGDETARAWR